MKKIFRIFLIIICFLIFIMVLDTTQAKIFNNSPFLKATKTHSEDGSYEKDIGILVETYICPEETKKTVFKWEKYNCEENIESKLTSINEKIIDYFSSNNHEYNNLSFNYVDYENKKVVVGLLDNSKEMQDKFKKFVVNSKYIVFMKGDYLVDYKLVVGNWEANGTQIKNIIGMEDGTPIYSDNYDEPYVLKIKSDGTYLLNLNNDEKQKEKGSFSLKEKEIIFKPDSKNGFVWKCDISSEQKLSCENYAFTFEKNNL